MKLSSSIPAIVLFSSLVGFAVVHLACAQLPAITADVAKEVICVENEIAKGDDTFEGIAIACGIQLLQDVETIVAVKQQDATLGETAKKVHHKAGK